MSPRVHDSPGRYFSDHGLSRPESGCCRTVLSSPYRKIAETADVALGTVDWIFRDLKEMGFLIETGKGNRRLTKLPKLMQRWVEAYPDQLRPKLIIDRFMAENFDW
jgi:hypothetical protein